jgi:hypothetical protein
MKLHANAAVSLTQRLRMVLRVLEQSWTVKDAAAAAETWSKEPVRSGWPATAPAARAVCWIGPELAELLGMPVSTVSKILTKDPNGPVGTARPGAGGALRAWRATP